MTTSVAVLAWAWVGQSAGHWLIVLADASLKGALILGVAGAVTLAMRKSSATARHLVWVLAMVSLLALPVLSMALPGWGVLPQWIDLESKMALTQGEAAPAHTMSEEPAGETMAPPITPEAAQYPPMVGEVAPQEAALPTETSVPAVLAADEAATKDPKKRFSAASVLPWVMPGWAVGVVVCLAPLLLGRLSLWRLRRSARAITAGPLAELLAKTSRQLGLKRPVILLVSDRRPMPMIWGIFRSKLLLPAEADEWSPQRQRLVLLHELAHAARRDCLAKLVAHIACALYWFNPLAWLAFRCLQREAEAACDDLVLSAGAEPAKYAEHILEIASGLQTHLLAAHSSIAMARKSRLEGRLLAILDPRRNRRRLTLIGVLLGLILVASVVVPIAVLHAREPSNPVQMDQNDNFVVTHTLYVWGHPNKPFYQLEGKTYRDVNKVVAHIGSLMKQYPFPYILVKTTSQFQREQRPIEDLSQRCRDIGFINMEYKCDLKDSPQVPSSAIQPDLAWGQKAKDILLGAGPVAKSQDLVSPVRIRYVLMNWSKGVNSIRFYGGPSVLLLGRPVWAGGSIRIFGPDGKQLQAAKAAPFPSKCIDIQQGKSYEGFLDLSNYFNLTQVGDYRVVLTLRVHPSNDPAGKKGFALSSGEFWMTIARPATQPATITKVYDIRDLAFVVRDLIPPPIVEFVEDDTAKGAGPEDNGLPRRKDAQGDHAEYRQEMIDKLLELIRETIAPGSWRPAGKFGSMRELNGHLVITQTQENHKQILKLISQLRDARRVLFAIEGKFISVAPEMDGRLRKWADTKRVSSDAKSKPAAQPAKIVLSDVDAQEFIRRAQADALTKILAAPRVVLFNTHRAYVRIGASRTVKLPVLDTAGQKKDAKLFDGAVLDVEGTVSADRRNVVATLRPSVTRVGPGAGPVELSQAKAETTVSIPDLATLLIRLTPTTSRLAGAREVTDPKTGKTRFQAVREPLKDAPPDRIIYLLVKPRIIIAREYEEHPVDGDATPATQPALGTEIEVAVTYTEGFPSKAVPVSGNMYLDLDTGRHQEFRTLPDSKTVRKAGVDIYYGREADGSGPRLETSNLQVLPLPKDAWRKSDLETVRRSLILGSPYALLPSGPRLLAFRTREGGIGILQIVSVIAKPAGIRIRYKLLAQAPAPSTGSGPSTQPGEAEDEATTKPTDAVAAKELERLWDRLESADSIEAYKAVVEMGKLGDAAVALIKARLRLPDISVGRIRQLIAKLDSDSFADREQATRDLSQLGRRAIPLLRKALTEAPSLEAKTRIERLLERWSRTSADSPVTPALRRAVRAVAVLERIGTPGAKDYLKNLAAQRVLPPVRFYHGEDFALETGFVPDKGSILFGEPLFVTFVVRNVSTQPYTFHFGGANRGSVRDNNFRITATGPGGKAVQDPHSYRNFGGFGGAVTLKPGQIHTKRLCLGLWCKFAGPGEYVVACRRILNGPRGPRAVAVTNTFPLTIRPADAKKMREVIATWGAALRNGGKDKVLEATTALAAIKDEAVIPYLIESLKMKEWRHKFMAVEGLARFNSDAAADGLCLALKDPDYALARDAAKALKRTGKINRAVDKLLAELEALETANRAVIIRALGHTRARHVGSTLVAALQHENTKVRQAAAEALGWLGYWEHIPILKKCLTGDDLVLRVAAVQALARLAQPIEPKWLVDVILAAKGKKRAIGGGKTIDDLPRSFHDATSMLRLHGKGQAATALVSCLDFDNPKTNSSYNFFIVNQIEGCRNGPPKFYSEGKYHHDPNTEGTPDQIEDNRLALAEWKKWLAKQEAVKRSALPKEVTKSLAEAMKIRVKHHSAGLAMWRELAALVKPGWTAQQMKLILTCPGGVGMGHSNGRVTISYGVQDGAFMVKAKGKYVRGASYKHGDGEDKIILTDPPTVTEIRLEKPAEKKPDELEGESEAAGDGEKVEETDAARKARLLKVFRAAKYAWMQAEPAKKLIELGDKEVVPDMVEMLKSENRRRRCNAAWVLAGLGDERGLEVVLSELKDTSERRTDRIRSDGRPDVVGQIRQDRYYAAHILGEIGDRRAVPHLIDVLKDKSIGFQAAIILGNLGDPSAVGPLKEMCESPDGDRRFWAGYALAKLGDSAGMPIVADSLKDPRWGQRRRAAEALGNIQSNLAVPALIEAVKDENVNVRVAAAKALGKLADRSAIQALEALFGDSAITTSGKPTAVRDAAAEAIRQIKKARNTEPAAQPALGREIEVAVTYTEGFPSKAVPVSGNMYLDLDTGRHQEFRTLPDSKTVRKAGVDIYYGREADGSGPRLDTSNLQVLPLPKDAWRKSDLETVRRSLILGSPYALLPSGPRLLAFRTREGGIGILQIVSVTAKPAGIRIRYKLLAQAPAPSTPSTSSTSSPQAGSGQASSPPSTQPVRQGSPQADRPIARVVPVFPLGEEADHACGFLIEFLDDRIDADQPIRKRVKIIDTELPQGALIFEVEIIDKGKRLLVSFPLVNYAIDSSPFPFSIGDTVIVTLKQGLAFTSGEKLAQDVRLTWKVAEKKGKRLDDSLRPAMFREPVTQEQLSKLAADHPRVRRLYLNDCPGITDLSAVGELKDLEALELGGWALRIDDLSPLAKLHNLKKLRVLGAFALADLAPLSGLDRLEKLTLYASGNLTDLKPLEKLQALSWLALSEIESLEDISPLAKLSNLEVLLIRGCKRVADLKPLAGLPKLRTLDAGSLPLLKDISPLSKLAGLTNLILCSTAVEDLSPLAKLKQLWYLDLGSCPQVSDISALAGLSKLEGLDLSGCPKVTDLRPLMGLKSLKSLDLKGLPAVPADQIKALRQALPDALIHTDDPADPADEPKPTAPEGASTQPVE